MYDAHQDTSSTRSAGQPGQQAGRSDTPKAVRQQPGGIMYRSFLSASLPLVMLAATLPSVAVAQAAPTTVKCMDGSTVAATGSDACVQHGGVAASVSNQAAGYTASPAAPGSAGQVTCKDGAIDAAGPSACSQHGGMGTPETSAAVHPQDASQPVQATTVPKGTLNPPTPSQSAYSSHSPVHPSDASQPVQATTLSKASSYGTPSNTDSTGATAKCNDGTYSHSTTTSTACSSHGGVAQLRAPTPPGPSN